MQVTIRKFEEKDIPNKVKWINDPANNRFLHYDLPLEEEKTRKWYRSIITRQDRYDAVIEADGVPCGLIGLLNIDSKNQKAEFYIAMGEAAYKRKGVAEKASRLLLDHAFGCLALNRVYLYTETKNTPARNLFEKIGFKKEGELIDDLYVRGNRVNRVLYAVKRDTYSFLPKRKEEKVETPVVYIGEISNNQLYMKREDLYPFSFGGNKARKAKLFFEEIDAGNYDCVVTYGSSSSNHCRIVSNMAAARGIKCVIISPQENLCITYNRQMADWFGAEFIVCPVAEVREKIEETLLLLSQQGRRPYFIAGGGHGDIGTQAYVDCYREIAAYEDEHNVQFAYVFLASGTGTTQAGLVCGQLMEKSDRKIVGISIARKEAYGRSVVMKSIKSYFESISFPISEETIDSHTEFVDKYIGEGYGSKLPAIEETIQACMVRHGIPLDGTYTGKAFWGMKSYLEENDIQGEKILFIHTGGTPLFFDGLQELQRDG